MTDPNSNPSSMDPEISLVDVVVILSRQWVIFMVVLVVFLVLGSWFVLTRAEEFRYSAIYELPARQYDNGEVLPWMEADELAENVKASIIHPIIGRASPDADGQQAMSRWFATDGRGRTIEIMADVTDDNADQAKTITSESLNALAQDQTAQYQDRVRDFDESISTLNQRIAEVGDKADTPGMGEFAGKLEEAKAELIIERQKLLPGRIVMEPTRSLNPVGMTPLLKMIIIIIASFIVAFVAAVFAEVMEQARRRIARPGT